MSATESNLFEAFRNRKPRGRGRVGWAADDGGGAAQGPPKEPAETIFSFKKTNAGFVVKHKAMTAEAAGQHGKKRRQLLQWVCIVGIRISYETLSFCF
jgi:hypothetical protein